MAVWIATLSGFLKKPKKGPFQGGEEHSWAIDHNSYGRSFLGQRQYASHYCWKAGAMPPRDSGGGRAVYCPGGDDPNPELGRHS